MTHEIKWLAEPEEHDYPAALSYLSLHYDEQQAQALIELLRAAPITSFKAKDVLRASQLPHLGGDNRHVRHNLKKMAEDKEMSPILLVREQPLLIADGYHRTCAVYLLNEDADIPCKIT